MCGAGNGACLTARLGEGAVIALVHLLCGLFQGGVGLAGLFLAVVIELAPQVRCGLKGHVQCGGVHGVGHSLTQIYPFAFTQHSDVVVGVPPLAWWRAGGMPLK